MNTPRTRYLALAGIVLYLAGMIVVLSAVTARAETCLTHPVLPGECLSQQTYNYVTRLEGDRVRLTGELVVATDAARAWQSSSESWRAKVGEVAAEYAWTTNRLERVERARDTWRTRAQDWRDLYWSTVTDAHASRLLVHTR
jgi:hypothetical protein